MTCLITALCVATIDASPVVMTASDGHSRDRAVTMMSGSTAVRRMYARNTGTQIPAIFSTHEMVPTTAVDVMTGEVVDLTIGDQISPEEQRRLQKQYDDYNAKHNLKPFGGLRPNCRDQYCTHSVSGIKF